MRNISYLTLSVAAATLLAMSGCSSDSDSVTSGPGVELAEDVNNSVVQGITRPMQTVAVEDGSNGKFPGQANVWDLSSNLAVNDGGGDQFDGALMVSIDGVDFPADQTYSELTFHTPLFGSADGIVSAVVDDGDFKTTLQGSYTALLNRGVSKLYQDVNLSNATGALSLNASYKTTSNSQFGISEIPGRTSYFSIAILDENGTQLLEPVHVAAGATGTFTDLNVSTYAGQSIRLMFECNAADFFTQIDAVSLTNGATEYVQNGDFETGDLTGWSIVEPSMSQNFTAGRRTIGDINVTRSFYTKPNSLWARFTDVYENITGTEVNAIVTYTSDLGTDAYGIIYYSPGTSNQALTIWDGGTGDRDAGFVYGSATTVDFLSDPILDSGSGEEMIYVDYNVSISANGKVTIVNYLLMNGKDTGLTATDINATATEIDNEAKAIYDGIKARNPLYLRGMTQEQIDTIYNF